MKKPSSPRQDTPKKKAPSLIGGSTAPVYPVVITRTGFGEIRVVYQDAGDATHVTEWALDGGSWRAVGSAAIEVGAYTHSVSFRVLTAGDAAPVPRNVTVKEDRRASIKVFYS